MLERIPADILPHGAAVGTLTATAAEELGLTTNVIVASGLIDAHAGGVALAGAHPSGTLALISGTSNCHMLCSEKRYSPTASGAILVGHVAKLLANRRRAKRRRALVEWTLQESGASANLFTRRSNADVIRFN